MEDSSELILRNQADILPGTLLVNLPGDDLAEHLPTGHFVSLNYGHFQSLSRIPEWSGQFGLDQSLQSKVEHAVIWMPKARRELDLLVAWTLDQMAADGRLWLVGPKRGGTESSGKALKSRLGGGHKRDSARHCQLWEFSVSPSARRFTLDEWIESGDVTVPVGGSNSNLMLAALPGVFSQGRLDDGTELLLKSLSGELKFPVLDFACGAGVIGAAVGRHWPGKQVSLLDVQWQALIASRHTLELNQLEGEVIAGNGLEGLNRRFGTIISNPPFHSGLKTDLDIVRRFIHQATTHLLPGGALWLVANAFLPYRDLLVERFPRVDVVAENTKFRVYRAGLR